MAKFCCAVWSVPAFGSLGVPQGLAHCQSFGSVMAAAEEVHRMVCAIGTGAKVEDSQVEQPAVDRAPIDGEEWTIIRLVRAIVTTA